MKSKIIKIFSNCSGKIKAYVFYSLKIKKES